MSTPPFINMPDGVGLFAPPDAPVPVLVAEARTDVTDVTGGADRTPAPARGDVLLVPGFTGSKEDFLAILEPLAAFGWRVAAMDLPGQGGAPALGPRGSHTAAHPGRLRRGGGAVVRPGPAACTSSGTRWAAW